MPPTGGVPSACPWGRTPNAPHGVRVQKQGRALRRGLLGAGWKAGGAARQRGGTSPETGRWPHQGTGEEAGREDMSPRRDAVGPSSPPGCLQQVRGRAGCRTSPRPGPADRASPLPGPKLCRGEVGPLLSLPTPAPTPAPGTQGGPLCWGPACWGTLLGTFPRSPLLLAESSQRQERGEGRRAGGRHCPLLPTANSSRRPRPGRAALSPWLSGPPACGLLPAAPKGLSRATRGAAPRRERASCCVGAAGLRPRDHASAGEGGSQKPST